MAGLKSEAGTVKTCEVLCLCDTFKDNERAERYLTKKMFQKVRLVQGYSNKST